LRTQQGAGCSPPTAQFANGAHSVSSRHHQQVFWGHKCKFTQKYELCRIQPFLKLPRRKANFLLLPAPLPSLFECVHEHTCSRSSLLKDFFFSLTTTWMRTGLVFATFAATFGATVALPSNFHAHGFARGRPGADSFSFSILQPSSRLTPSCIRLRGGGGQCTNPLGCGGRPLPDALGFGAWQASWLNGGSTLYVPLAGLAALVLLGNAVDGTRGW
jgi:hypothetical protein